MNKSLFQISLFTIIFPFISYAQTSMRDLWIQMPDSIVAYLDKEKRTEIAELYRTKMKSELKNKLDGTTVLDTLTDDYACVTLNVSATLQLKKLSTDNSFVICVVKKFKAPEIESEVSFFTQEWQPVKDNFGLPTSNDIEKIKTDFTNRPDSMPATKYDELLSLFDFVMLSADLSASEPVISFTLSLPLLNDEDKKNIIPIIKQRKFKWNGHAFMEC
ncbi:DUF3256 family protein [Prevotella sp. OH937_COT-195]|uniref:DUF3256 family protein n=1 Tax=Prevotella sp. OH937_COT-195 TaxID=2491051 RepID=UPI000F6500B6|nr:DUF3256 family protein [Prevotella sp. OH937_COT-195]RRD01902.1 DUF3256 family protein [Prevotella sp. OH937_COT-195]